MTCWEVFTGGKIPYPGVHPLELPNQLENGYRMEKPQNSACPDEVYGAACVHVGGFGGRRVEEGMG